MKFTARVLAAASAVSMMTAVPAPAQAQSYDTVLYDTLLDCTALQILFAQAADKPEDKNDAANKAVGYLTAANTLSGTEIKDLGPVMAPRRQKILGMLDKKDGSAERLTKSCAAIFLVGKNALAAANSK